MFTLQDALSAVKNKPEFSVKDKGTYTVIDYNVNSKTTFVGETDAETKILLNLRGTAFDNESNKIIRLGYDKFFNHGEFPEIDKKLDFSEDHVITQKLDGSCIFPIYTRDEGILLGTRAGVTDVSKMADEWLSTECHNVADYWDFICYCKQAGVTPIFEFCSRKNRVVLDYPNANLILTAVRTIATGGYLSYAVLCYLAEDFNIPVVSRIEPLATQDAFVGFHQSVTDQLDDEGVVIRFESGNLTGHMIKLKSADYVMKHKAVDGLRFEKDVLYMALDGLIDDVYPLLAVDTMVRVQSHVEAFMVKFFAVQNVILNEHDLFKNLETQKDFALAIKDNKYKSFLFSLRAGRIPLSQAVSDYCKKQCGTQTSTKELKEFLDFQNEYVI